MLNPILFGYKENQAAGKRIAAALGCAWHYPGSDYEWNENDLVINWGNGGPLGLPQRAKILNKYTAVCRSVYKDVTFEFLENAGVSIPARTRVKDIARQWIEQGEIVFCRQTLAGKNGEGIEIARRLDELVNAPLYTKYVHNDREFRVHVFKGEYIFATEKKADTEALNVDPMVKSGENWCMGWVDDVPETVKDQCIRATNALGLDFAAIDVGYCTLRTGSSEPRTSWVFESNTAPGAFGPITTQKYVEAIRKACETS